MRIFAGSEWLLAASTFVCVRFEAISPEILRNDRYDGWIRWKGGSEYIISFSARKGDIG